MRHSILITALLLCRSPIVEADAIDHYVDFTLGYSRGDFNSGQDAELSQLQVTYGQVLENYDFSVVIPYLFLSDSFVDESGLGDITLHAGMTLSDNGSSVDDLYASIAIKLPTANDAKGLGTGEVDLGGFLTYTHDFNQVSLSLQGGYIVTGDGLFQQHENIFVYGAGLSNIIIPWYFYVSLDGRQQVLDTGDAPLELSGGFFYQLNPKQFVKMEGFAGLSNSSPDMGVAIGFVNWF
jgi:hypothetical protein